MVGPLKSMYTTPNLPRVSKTTLISNILPCSPQAITEWPLCAIQSILLFVKLCVLIFCLENMVRIEFYFLYHQWALWGWPFKMYLIELGLEWANFKSSCFWDQIAWVHSTAPICYWLVVWTRECNLTPWSFRSLICKVNNNSMHFIGLR